MTERFVRERARCALRESRALMMRESPEPLGAFFIGNAPVGRLTGRVRNSLLGERYREFVRHSPIGMTLNADPHPEARSACLDTLLLKLREDGLLGTPCRETVDIVYHGEKLARIDRSAIRFFGLRTTVARLIADTADGRWLLQKRSLSKRIAPGLLDNFAAGMVASDETAAECMSRESREETGLMIPFQSLTPDTELGFLSSRVVEEGFLSEDNVVFRIRLPEGFRPRPATGEVESFCLLNDEELLHAVESGRMMPEAAHIFLTLLAQD